jgi:uncharacterized protein
MKLSYSQTKNITNLQKHGIALEAAQLLDWDLLIVAEDERHDYGEMRLIGFAPIAKRLYCIVYTERNENIHVISLRKANTREVKRYVETRKNIKSE